MPDYTLTAETGSFTATGQGALLSRRLVAAKRSFRLRGYPADIRKQSPVQTAPTTPLAVQRGVLQACQIAMGGLGIKVYDHVPHGQPFPFVAMDQHQVLENDGVAIHGFVHNFFLSVWSDYRGAKQVWTVLDALWTGLHERTLLLENGAYVLGRVTEQRADQDADGLTYQGNLTLRVLSNPF